MQIHKEILDKKRQDYLKQLSDFADWGFLAGGTALALQLGHRSSYDFDIFLKEELKEKAIKFIDNRLDIKSVSVRNSEEFSFFTRDDIKFSFVYYPFNLDKYIIKNERLPIPLLSVLGVSVSKAYALNRRGVWRDYLDLYFVVKEKLLSLEDISNEAQKVYGELFSKKLFYSQLVYTDDISEAEIKASRLKGEAVSKSSVKDFFAKEIKKELGR